MNLTVIGLEILRSFDFENHSFVGEFFFKDIFFCRLFFGGVFVNVEGSFVGLCFVPRFRNRTRE